VIGIHFNAIPFRVGKVDRLAHGVVRGTLELHVYRHGMGYPAGQISA
jgi:hypothetical protein